MHVEQGQLRFFAQSVSAAEVGVDRSAVHRSRIRKPHLVSSNWIGDPLRGLPLLTVSGAGDRLVLGACRPQIESSRGPNGRIS
jgi:UPF0288 family protein (methanogenesis marker protein 3)